MTINNRDYTGRKNRRFTRQRIDLKIYKISFKLSEKMQADTTVIGPVMSIRTKTCRSNEEALRGPQVSKRLYAVHKGERGGRTLSDGSHSYIECTDS